jgi:hypothetical protein
MQLWRFLLVVFVSLNPIFSSKPIHDRLKWDETETVVVTLTTSNPSGKSEKSHAFAVHLGKHYAKCWMIR